MKVRNPGPLTQRVGSFWFPVGEPVECDEVTGKYVVGEMGFERLDTPKPIAEGPPVTKPAQGKKK